MRAPRLTNLVVPLLAIFVTHCGGASEQVAPSTDSPTPVRSGWPMYRGIWPEPATRRLLKSLRTTCRA